MAEPLRFAPKEPLLALYEATWAEITRLRDYEWKIAYYFVGISAGLITLLANDSIRPLLNGYGYLRIALTIIQAVAAVFAVFYLEMTHRYLSQQRNIRRQIEETLGFYEPGKLGTSALLPSEWRGKRITSSFQRIGLLLPLMTMVLAVQGLTIFLIWHVA
jgi:hypothetical protein